MSTTYPFSLPTAANVRVESRLRPEQVSPAFSTNADLESDIANRIAGKADVVYSKLKRAAAPYSWPYLDTQVTQAYEDQVTANAAIDTNEQKDMASQAVDKYTLASLYGSAGQLNSAYWRRADEYKVEADAIVAGIAEGILFVKKILMIQDGRNAASSSNSSTGSAAVVSTW